MNSMLDKIKSTITISLGTKNRLRKLKGSQSYEDYINYLLRVRNQEIHKSGNVIELQKTKRKNALLGFENYKILYSYNPYTGSKNFRFDIKVQTVRKKGKVISIDKFISDLSITKKDKEERIAIEYIFYFTMLSDAITKEVESLFRHKGRLEDYYQWEQEFKTLNLPKKSFEEDVMEKLTNYNQGISEFR